MRRIYALVLLFPIALLSGSCSEDNLVLTCGNGVKDIGETCDGDCPTGCSDGNPCTSDTLYGSPDNCNVVCHFEPISTCWDGDWCCPQGCSPDNDVDCSPYCGNGQLDTGETCDGDCPTGCNDGNPCTIDILTGSASNCSSACSFEYIAECTAGDGCCPRGCSTKSDGDCSPSCGNGKLESSETCDPPSGCPAGCDDGNPCTIDSLTGSAENCNATCSHQTLFICADGDACCPAGCNANTDGDCAPFCGNSALEEGEICDGNCPSQCNDGNPCTIDTMTGSAENCDAICNYEQLTDCTDADGCCPVDCNSNTDNDCSPSCGNEVIESGETCDPPATCPGDCDDGDPCTSDQMTGSAENCNVECTRIPITQCTDDDGCCLAACNANIDNDCDPFCGNAITEEGETCDGDCPTLCFDNDPCTSDRLIGSAGNCDAVCPYDPVTDCVNADGCCPSGCNYFADDDCEVCDTGFHPCGSACCPWEIQTVDSPGTVGAANSLKIDDDDNPHIAYIDFTNKSLEYASWDGNDWNFQTVDTAWDTGRVPSLALDHSNNPHIAYLEFISTESRYELKYARWNGSSWDIQTVAGSGNAMDLSLALDSGDDPHIAYYNYVNTSSAELHLASWNGSGWTVQTVDSGGFVGTHPSLALTETDTPHISYIDPTNTNLKHAYWSGSQWETEVVDSGNITGGSTSLALDNTNSPHISYHESTSQELRYASWNGLGWDIYTVDSGDFTGFYNSMSLDGGGWPHIAYSYGGLGADLKYARWNGGSWETQTVDDDGRVGEYEISVALDSNADPHISYFDSTNSDLKYARW